MHLSPRRSALPASFLVLLAACGGGGGGGGAVDVPFTSFSALGPNQRANMTGISQTASGTGTPVVGGLLVDSVSMGPLDTSGNSGAQITFDLNRNISAMSFTAPQSSAGFVSGVDCSAGPVCVADTATAAGVLGNPSFASHNWNYQTYGVWLVQPSATTFQTGAISVGATTPGNAVPTTGNAAFTGFTSGFYTENRQAFFTSAIVNANADWQNRNIAFSTTNTFMGNIFTGGAPIAAPDLDLAGTLNYGLGSNQFSGTVTATRFSLNGTATGRFYGPAAQEMGGVYSLTGFGVGIGATSMTGAFGARRP